MTGKSFFASLSEFLHNEAEIRALLAAEEGDFEMLAAYIEEGGVLRTKEGRDFVGDRLRGKKQKRGKKRTLAQEAKEINLLIIIRGIQQDFSCSEYRACEILLDACPNLDRDALRTYLRRAKQTLDDAFGKEQPTTVPKDEDF